MNHSLIVLSVGGSVWYMIRNLRHTVTIDSVLANSKTQNAFLFTVNAIFCHGYPLAVEPGSMPRPLVQKKKLGEIFYLLICSFLPCLSWLLSIRVRKSRRDLRINLYVSDFFLMQSSGFLCIVLLVWYLTEEGHGLCQISEAVECNCAGINDEMNISATHCFFFFLSILNMSCTAMTTLGGNEDEFVTIIWEGSNNIF